MLCPYCIILAQINNILFLPFAFLAFFFFYEHYILYASFLFTDPPKKMKKYEEYFAFDNKMTLHTKVMQENTLSEKEIGVNKTIWSSHWRLEMWIMATIQELM